MTRRARALAGATLCLCAAWASPQAALASGPGVFMSLADWSDAARRATRTAAGMQPPDGVPALVIVPHHAPAADLIIAGIDVAVDRWHAPPERVILLAPDHRHLSRGPAMTLDRDWLTVRGTVRPDRGALLDITRARVVTIEPEVATEHGLGTVMPVLANRLPGVPVVPVAVRSDLNAAEVRALGRALGPWARGALVVAAVDFSHGLPLRAAASADLESIEALRRLDGAAFLEWGSEHSDGAGALPLAVQLARGLGARTFDLGARSNSHRIGGPPTDVTTYVVGFVSAPQAVASGPWRPGGSDDVPVASAIPFPALRMISSAVRTSPSP